MPNSVLKSLQAAMISSVRTISLVEIDPKVSIKPGSDSGSSGCRTQTDAVLRDDKPQMRKFPLLEVMQHREMEDAWIVVDGEVYDITSFMESHPGGAQIILEHTADGDAGSLMRGADHPDSHSHSKSAFGMLKQFHIGSLQDPQRNLTTSYMKENSEKLGHTKDFQVDLSKPLVFQVGKLGDGYHDWVHDPIISPRSPRFFENDIAELLTTTKWWIIPLIYLPVLLWSERDALQRGNNIWDIGYLMFFGMMTWTLLEYVMHRFLFHMKTSSYWMNTIHYVLHGFHHKHPMDGSRLVFPPALSLVFSFVIWYGFSLLMSRKALPAFFGGAIFGYILYDLTHYYFHFGRPFNNIGRKMKRYHLNHHFKVQDNAFGITSPVWDKMLGTFPKKKAV